MTNQKKIVRILLRQSQSPFPELYVQVYGDGLRDCRDMLASTGWKIEDGVASKCGDREFAVLVAEAIELAGCDVRLSPRRENLLQGSLLTSDGTRIGY